MAREVIGMALYDYYDTTRSPCADWVERRTRVFKEEGGSEQHDRVEERSLSVIAVRVGSAAVWSGC
jgi:hypothetical protein